MSANVWNRTTRIVVLVLLSVAGAWFLWRIRPMFGPLVIAGFIAYLLNPVVDFAVARTRLRRAGAKNPQAIVAAFMPAVAARGT